MPIYCEECSQIAATLRRVGEDQRSSTPGALENLWRRVPGWIASRHGVPAYALAAALALMVPAYWWVVTGPDAAAAPSVLSPPVSIESQAERGPVAAATRIDLQQSGTVMTLFVPVDPGQFRYDLEIRSAAGHVVFAARDATSFDGIGTFALSLPAGSLENGEYQARIVEIERETGEMAETYEFPFEVAAP